MRRLLEVAARGLHIRCYFRSISFASTASLRAARSVRWWRMGTGRHLPSRVGSGAGLPRQPGNSPRDSVASRGGGLPLPDIHVLPASGHWPFAGAPETVQRLLVEFVSRVGATQ